MKIQASPPIISRRFSLPPFHSRRFDSTFTPNQQKHHPLSLFDPITITFLSYNPFMFHNFPIFKILKNPTLFVSS
ncbi:hypothetical protein L6452_42939 [Arctium lappa]|uniref:Uncharacterized protein n=1 Tax=Arctium lappa TaxID=4217 RepID=A0ACB8XK72_ARCLA|nr:hypothetical protein L6452_42939 [Arctium lappa]